MIAAEGEQKASRALREASEVIGDSPAALQLRYLQVNIISQFMCICAGLSLLIYYYYRSNIFLMIRHCRRYLRTVSFSRSSFNFRH